MFKYLKMLALGMLVVGLMASSVFAAASASFFTTGLNTQVNIGLEALGVARNFRIAGDGGANGSVGNAALSTSPTTNFLSGDFLNVTFTNAAFDGSQVALCVATGNTITNTAVTVDTPTANVTNWAFRIGVSGVSAGQTIFVTNDYSTGSCNLSNKTLNIHFPAMSSAALAQVAFSGITSGGSPIGGANSATLNFANIGRQYTTAYGSSTSTIDFSGNATSNGAHFINGNTANQGSANIANNASMALTATGSSLTVSAILSLQDSASWQGIQRVYVSGAGDCTATANNVANNAINSSSGTVNLSIPANAFNGSSPVASYTGNVCVDVKGNAALQTRTIKGAYTISVSTGGNSDPQDAFSAIQSWVSNGFQGIVPYINGSSTFATICFINNMSAASGSVTASILTAESGASLAALAGLSVATLPPGQTMRVDFTQSGSTVVMIPYTYSGGTEIAGTAIPLTGIATNDRYSAIINVGASPTQVTANCIQLDPAGSKRAVPVLTQSGSSAPWNY